MISGDINLLPEKAVEKLYSVRINKERAYFLLAVVLALTAITILSTIMYRMYGQSVAEARVLLESQRQKLAEQNDLWNDIIMLNETSTKVEPLVADTFRMRETWQAVNEELDALTLHSFRREDTHHYIVEVHGNTAEESTAYVLALQEQLPQAHVLLMSIRQDEQGLIFSFVIQYE